MRARNSLIMNSSTQSDPPKPDGSSSERTDRGQAEISLVMPCYNEEELVADTVRELIQAFDRAGHRIELITVNNGSTDSTGEILKGLSDQQSNIIYHHVDVNQGYGHGILVGLAQCSAPWAGFIAADRQVDPGDVVKLYEMAARLKEPRLLKIRRRFRTEGLGRRIVSVTYNAFVHMLFGKLGTTDINASPKIVPRAYLKLMSLQSKDWFLDPEIMIKAKRLSLGVLELSVFARMRTGGSSAVKPTTCWEFFVNLLSSRFGPKRKLLAVEPVGKADSGKTAPAV